MVKERYVSFGEQVGAVPSLTLAPTDVPPRLRNNVWNLAGPLFADAGRYGPELSPAGFLQSMSRDKGWIADDHRYQYHSDYAARIKDWLLTGADWHEVDEFLQSFPRWAGIQDPANWEAAVDRLLFQERSPYRFVNHKLQPIASEEERAPTGRANPDFTAAEAGSGTTRFCMTMSTTQSLHATFYQKECRSPSRTRSSPSRATTCGTRRSISCSQRAS
jgi:hypothetical protein